MIKRRIDSLGKDLRDPATRQMSLAYQGAVEAVFAILICAGIGYLADERWSSEPKGLLIGVGIGFSAFVLRLVRLGREMSGKSKEEGSSADESVENQKNDQ
ncbi:MAG: AtpZ/AtpI family protein [Deltaproteobacteria bacterium]|nr:AtpZ/AtpI family protein [Deltaproteobacteria bacterium]